MSLLFKSRSTAIHHARPPALAITSLAVVFAPAISRSLDCAWRTLDPGSTDAVAMGPEHRFPRPRLAALIDGLAADTAAYPGSRCWSSGGKTNAIGSTWPTTSPRTRRVVGSQQETSPSRRHLQTAAVLPAN